MFKSFIKSAELTSTDGVHHNKEKYFENIEKNLKKGENGMKSVDQLDGKLIEDEEDESWRVNICTFPNNLVKPTEEELKFRSSFEKNRIQEEKEKIIEEKEMISNFKKAQANLIIKKNLDPKQKYNQLELLNNTSNQETKSLTSSQNILLKIKKRPESSLDSSRELHQSKQQQNKTKQTFMKESNQTKKVSEKVTSNKSFNKQVPKKDEVKLNKFFEAYNSDSGEEEKEKREDESK